MVARRPLYASLREKHPSRRGEGGEGRLGKKDTGYLYKAFMVARRPLVSHSLSRCPVQWVLAEIRGRSIVGARVVGCGGARKIRVSLQGPCGCPASQSRPVGSSRNQESSYCRGGACPRPGPTCGCPGPLPPPWAYWPCGCPASQPLLLGGT